MTEELWQQFQLSVFSGQLSESGLSVGQEAGKLKTGIQKAENREQKIDYRSIHHSSWPTYDESLIHDATVPVVIQVNGKRRAEISVSREELANQEAIENKARELVSKYLELPVKKVVYVPGKILNFVV